MKLRHVLPGMWFLCQLYIWELTWKECARTWLKIRFWLSIYRWSRKGAIIDHLHAWSCLSGDPRPAEPARRKGGKLLPRSNNHVSIQKCFQGNERRRWTHLSREWLSALVLNSSCLLCIVTTDHHLSKQSFLHPKFQILRPGTKAIFRNYYWCLPKFVLGSWWNGKNNASVESFGSSYQSHKVQFTFSS